MECRICENYQVHNFLGVHGIQLQNTKQEKTNFQQVIHISLIIHECKVYIY